MNNYCKYYCTAPDTLCPYWIGISCEYEDACDEDFCILPCHKGGCVDG